MLDIRNLSVSYKNQKVLNELNLQLSEGLVFGLLGKNGAGKTTFFESLYQTIAFSGQQNFRGEKLTREMISYLETENYFYPYIKGKEYLEYFVEKEDKNKIEELAKRFQLPLDKYVQDYSSGMKKKIALIGMLLLDKPICILDEPFNGVDFEGVHLIYETIEELKSKNKIVIISSHIIETLFNTCDSIGILKVGKIENIFDQQNFSQIQDFSF